MRGGQSVDVPRHLLAKHGDEMSLHFCAAVEIRDLTDGEVPEWIPLFPAPEGEDRIVDTRDGRRWVLPSFEAFLENQARYQMDPPLDFDHESENWRGSTEAGGFIKEFRENEDGSVDGRLDWNQLGHDAVREKRYRYISPAFRVAWQTTTIDGAEVIDWDAPQVIYHVTSAALTNRPAFRMRALASAQRHRLEKALALASAPTTARPPTPTTTDTRKPSHMDLASLIALLGLPAGSTEAEVTRSLSTAKANLARFGLSPASSIDEGAAALERCSTPDPEKFVAADLLKAEQTARAAAEAKLAEVATAARDKEVGAWIESAKASGQLLPAQELTIREMCKTDAGFASARSIIDAAPKRLGDAPKSPAKASDSKAAPADMSGIPAELIEITKHTGQDPSELVELHKESLAKYGAAS